MATAYFNDTITGDGDWNNAVNWWSNVGATVPFGGVPASTDDVITQTAVQTLTSGQTCKTLSLGAAYADASVSTLTVTGNVVMTAAGSITGGTISGGAAWTMNPGSSISGGTLSCAGTFTCNASSLSGADLTADTFVLNAAANINPNSITAVCQFNAGGFAGTTITGNCTFNGVSSLAAGTVTGNATFNGASSLGAGTVTGNATFNGTSSNAGGTVTGLGTFNDQSYNQGTVGTLALVAEGLSGIGAAPSFTFTRTTIQHGINGSAILGMI